MLMGPGVTVAWAHPTLLFTEPAAQTAVAASPQLITLLFNEPVTIAERAIVLLDEAGREVPTGPVAVARQGRVVTAQPSRTLEPGTYTVRWRVTGSDGDQVEQDFRFAVGMTLAAAAGAGAQERPAWGEAALRWMLFAGLAVAVGGLIAQRSTATARAEQPALPPVRSWAPAGLIVALAGVLGLMALRGFDAGTMAALWDGRAGLVLLAEAVGLLAALAIVKLRRWALAPLAVVIIAEGIRSHLGTIDGTWGAALTGVHLAAITVWVGALLHSVRAIVAWRRVTGAVRWVLASYVRLALWTYVVVVATGVVSALVLVPLSQLFSTTYGRVLLIKLALVAAASAAALGARIIHRDASRSTRLRRLMRAESGLLAVILVASAVLVSTPPPTGQTSTATPPPPPAGPLLPLGTLAGQIGVSVTASDGLLVLRLSTPRRGDYYAPEPGQQFSLAVSVGDAVLALTGCGSGCYYARPVWRDGDNVLSLRAEATGWVGGDTGLIVAWPPRPGADELAAAVAATRAAGTMIVYETVTSDTRTAPAAPNRLDLDADFFLSQEPYADGTAPIAVRTSADSAPVQLALGYPAASINVQLTLDEKGRIAAETLTDAKHLVTRRIVYPNGA
jgi:copper transport protein